MVAGLERSAILQVVVAPNASVLSLGLLSKHFFRELCFAPFNPRKMVHAALLLLMLEAAFTNLVSPSA
jgi:hypothetical protein